MDDNNKNTPPAYEDEIDLRELFLTIWQNKFLIILITALIVTLASFYAYYKEPVYESKAAFEIGIVNEEVLVEPNILKKEIEVVFDVEENKGFEENKAIVHNVEITDNILTVTTRGLSKADAKQMLENVSKYIKTKYKYKVTDRIEILNERAKQMKKELASINSRIDTYKNKIKKYEQNIKIINEKRVNDKAQETLFALEEINNQRLIQSLQDKIEELKLQKQEIRNIQLKRVKLAMTEPYTHNTRVLGKIEVSENPVAPNKKLIIVVAFVTGIILSVFLIFFKEFIKGFKDYTENK
ncbi:Wzz/FepE/Etk N-terminal domain-containing protein [Flexistipes sp.]|uniref:Wzz/FepE/Etk N-terminal domain-containing protein n=1 Tax=Flexistipes sp. TaxID=3088135 RepID=UPI002E218B6F|nr:Wzz/FepE/Etk N-terminal domain-containing protein [Flexistipes sp.]